MKPERSIRAAVEAAALMVAMILTMVDWKDPGIATLLAQNPAASARGQPQVDEAADARTDIRVSEIPDHAGR